MNFEEAEAKFRQLQARVQRGEPISRAEYEDQVSQLAVQDDNGVLWEINPRTGKWMYFDGAEWVAGAPPGHDSSLVVPMPGGLAAAATSSAPPTVAPTVSAPPTPKPFTPPPPPPVRARTSSPSAPESVPTYKRAGQDKKSPLAKPSSDVPSGGDQKPPRSTRQGGMSRREWIPFAIGAVVLLICAIVLLVVVNVVLPAVSPKATPTITRIPTAVNSPVPTIVRLPSPTPIPPTPVPVAAKITSDTPANVRNKPTTSGSTILTKLKKDTAITLVAAGPTDATGNTWYQINLPDNPTPGWIRSDVFQIVSGDPKTLPTSGGVATPTPTKSAVAPTTVKATATLTPIGVIAPTATTKP